MKIGLAAPRDVSRHANDGAAESQMMRRARQILREVEGESHCVPEEMRAWWLAYLTRQRNRYLDVLSLLGDPNPGVRILEVGCAPGHFTVLMKRLGFNVQGVDLDPGRAGSLWEKWGISIARTDIERETLPFAPDTFDLVLFTEVLEHLRINPLHALREMHRVLKPGGQLLLATPNITPMHRMRFLFGQSYLASPARAFQELESLGHMGHFRLYTSTEIEELLSVPGFRVVRTMFLGRLSSDWRTRLLMAMWRRKEIFRSHLYLFAAKAPGSSLVDRPRARGGGT